MRYRSAVLISLFLSAICGSPAHAQSAYYILIGGQWYRLEAVAVIFACCVGGLAMIWNSGFLASIIPEGESSEEAAIRIEREAALLRARKRKTDAETDLRASLIDKARLDAEYQEISKIIEHDKKLRGIHRSAS